MRLFISAPYADHRIMKIWNYITLPFFFVGAKAREKNASNLFLALWGWVCQRVVSMRLEMKNYTEFKQFSFHAYKTMKTKIAYIAFALQIQTVRQATDNMCAGNFWNRIVSPENECIKTTGEHIQSTNKNLNRILWPNRVEMSVRL